MPWMHVDLRFAIRITRYVQNEAFDNRRFIFVHVARASRDDRHVPVPRVRETAVVTLYVIREAFEDVPFADVCRARLGPRVPDDVNPGGTDQLNQVDVTKSLKVSVDCVHMSPSPMGSPQALEAFDSGGQFPARQPYGRVLRKQ